VGLTSDSPLSFDITVAFPLSGQGRPPQKDALLQENTVEFNTQPGCTSVNASRRKLPGTTHHSRPRRLARSYLVRLFHSLPLSGLRRRTLTPLVLLLCHFRRCFPRLVRWTLHPTLLKRIRDYPMVGAKKMKDFVVCTNAAGNIETQFIGEQNSQIKC